jgi:hypothetical protein
VGGGVGSGVGLGGGVAVAVGDGVAVGIQGLGLGDGLAVAVTVGSGCRLGVATVSAGSAVGARVPESEQLSGVQIKIKMRGKQIRIWLGFTIYKAPENRASLLRYRRYYITSS